MSTSSYFLGGITITKTKNVNIYKFITLYKLLIEHFNINKSFVWINLNSKFMINLFKAF